jgi:hypothetical protein
LEAATSAGQARDFEKNRAILSETQAVWPFEILDKPDDRAVSRIKSIDAPNWLLFLVWNPLALNAPRPDGAHRAGR